MKRADQMEIFQNKRRPSEELHFFLSNQFQQKLPFNLHKTRAYTNFLRYHERILARLRVHQHAAINNWNMTEWSPIRSVIIRVINKIGRLQKESPIC